MQKGDISFSFFVPTDKDAGNSKSEVAAIDPLVAMSRVGQKTVSDIMSTRLFFVLCREK